MTSWSQDAAIALHDVHGRLAEAKELISNASADEWVSSAADAYESLLSRYRASLTALLAVCSEGEYSVLRHTNAADECTRAGSYCL